MLCAGCLNLLDDARYNADAAASAGPSPTFSSLRLTWSGPLAAGDSVTITYSVILTGGGDGIVDNMAFQSRCLPGTSGCPTPDTPTTCVGGFDPDTDVPCDDVEFHLPRLTIVKSATHTDLPANGEDVTYTVTITNIGPGDYTATALATMTDDLTDVLDDATGYSPLPEGHMRAAWACLVLFLDLNGDRWAGRRTPTACAAFGHCAGEGTVNRPLMRRWRAPSTRVSPRGLGGRLLASATSRSLTRSRARGDFASSGPSKLVPRR